MADFDRDRLTPRALSQRNHRFDVAGLVRSVADVSASAASDPHPSAPEIAERIVDARRAKRSVVLAFGAHAVRNGLGPMLLELARRGWVTHLASQGAGSIHDWELAYCGATCEPVEANVRDGSFGLWDETGRLPLLALAVHALSGRGYGAAVGHLIRDGYLEVPDPATANTGGSPAERAALAELAELLHRIDQEPGRIEIPHPHAAHSVQAGAIEIGVPFTVHPGIGYDIVYEHPAAVGAVYGRAAQRDFLRFVGSVDELGPEGVYLSVGSAVMSPMVFEKALAMARHAQLAEGKAPSSPFVVVNDIQPSPWDWSNGEPPPDNPAYYLRFAKSFSRLASELRYVECDNARLIGSLFNALDSGDSDAVG